MPNCFQLTRVGESSPSTLSEVDDAIWRHFGQEPMPDAYCVGWVDTIGLRLAMGRELASQEMRDSLRDAYVEESGNELIVEILDFLIDNYTANAWASR